MFFNCLVQISQFLLNNIDFMGELCLCMRFHTEILLHLLNILIVLGFSLLKLLKFYYVSLYILLDHQSIRVK